MKSTLKFLPLIVALAVVSCAKNEITPEPEPQPQEGPKMTVTMSSGETKTAMVASTETEGVFTTKWTKGDQLGVFVRSNGADVDKNVATTALEADATTATFAVSVTQPQEATKYEFYTYYPYSSIEGQSYKAVKVEIPSEQSPANESFDPKADVLSGYPIEKAVTAGQSELSDLSLQFIRKTSVVRLLVPSCKDFDGISGESYVTEVKVTFDKNVVGTASWDITDKADLTLDESTASKTVVVKYGSSEHKVTDDIWLSIAPVSGVSSISFAFKVADNAYLHATASLSTPVSFTAGAVKKFSVPISATSWDLKSYGYKYEKVTSEPSDWRGEYLIVGENSNTLYACDQKSIGSWGSCTEVTAAADGSITGTATVNGYAFTVVSGTVAGTYAFVFQNGGYVSSGAAKEFNKETTANASKTDFILTPDGDFVEVKSYSNSKRTLMYNYNNGSGGLRFYDDGTSNGVRLYKKVEDYSVIVPVIAEPQGIPDAISKDGVIDAEFTCGITNLGKNSVSVKSFDGTVVTAATVDYADGTATVTYTVAANTDADRHGSITLKAGDTEKAIDLYQETGVVLPVISDVDDQNVTYEASNELSFDVTITNVGTNEVSCTVDGTVVTAASAALKSGDVYTVTYTVTENEGETSRNGIVTVKCSTQSSDVNIIQGVNASLIKTFNKTTLADIAYGDVVILIGNDTYAMTNDNGTVSAPAAINLSSKISGTKLSGKIDDNCLWNISGNATDGYTIYPNGDFATWLYCNTEATSGSNNNMRVGTGTRKVFELNESYFVTKDTYTKRYLSIYSGADWRGYIDTNNNPASMTFYVLDDGKQSSDLAWSVSTKEIGLDDIVTEMPTLSGHSASSATYTSSNSTVATIDASGNVTLVGVGSTTITAYVAADETYRAGQATYTLTVTAPTRAFSADPTSFADVVAAGTTGNALTVTASDKVEWSIANSGLTNVTCSATASGDNYIGDGTITFDVPANTGVARQFTLTLSTQTQYVAASSIVVTVDQLGAVDSKSFGVTESGQTINVVNTEYDDTPIHITGDSDVAWTATLTSGDSDAIAFDNDSGKGPTDFGVLIYANTGAARDFIITIATTDELVPEPRSHTVTIHQAAGASGLSKGKAFDYTFSTKTPSSEKFSSEGTKSLSNDTTEDKINCTLASDNAGYWAYEDADGLHMGSGKNSISYANFTFGYVAYCSDTSKDGVAKITVMCRAGGKSPQVEVIVGTKSLGKQSISNTLTTYTFTPSGSTLLQGDVVVKISQTSATKAIYIKNIDINPAEE